MWESSAKTAKFICCIAFLRKTSCLWVFLDELPLGSCTAIFAEVGRLTSGFSPAKRPFFMFFLKKHPFSRFSGEISGAQKLWYLGYTILCGRFFSGKLVSLSLLCRQSPLTAVAVALELCVAVWLPKKGWLRRCKHCQLSGRNIRRILRRIEVWNLGDLT